MGSSLGVALIGAIVLAGLAGAFVSKIQSDARINQAVAGQVSVAVGAGLSFVATDEVRAAATKAGLDAPTTEAIVDDYQQAQLQALRGGFLATAIFSLISLASTRHLPHTRPSAQPEKETVAAPA